MEAIIYTANTGCAKLTAQGRGKSDKSGAVLDRYNAQR